MIYGEELRAAIQKLGLNPNSFAKHCTLESGGTLSAQAIDDLIRKSRVNAREETIKAVEAVLERACPHCGKYMETNDTGDPKASAKAGGRPRKA